MAGILASCAWESLSGGASPESIGEKRGGGVGRPPSTVRITDVVIATAYR